MANDADFDAIRDWVAKGNRLTVDKSGNIVAPIDTPATPAASAPGAADAAPNDAPQAPQAADASPVKAAKASAKKAKEIKYREPNNETDAKERNVTVTGAKDLFGRFTRAIANLPTPGGNLALLLILVFFAWAVIPINHGATRVQLIWLVLTGRADLQNQPDTSQGNDNGGKWWTPYLDPSSTANGGGSNGANTSALPAPAEWSADVLDAPRMGAGL